MSPHLQAKLLHVLQDAEFSRLGGKKPVKVNVRVLAATNKKLKEAVLRASFETISISDSMSSSSRFLRYATGAKTFPCFAINFWTNTASDTRASCSSSRKN